jgi:xanthine/CO dehydrogenase XdhC/CoxF family maturation factor
VVDLFQMKDIYDIVQEFRKRRGEQFALATLVRAEGSSYRRPGARMLVCAGGQTVGSLSGGCLEQEVADCGKEVMRSGAPTLLSFDTRRRFGCDGKIDILVEPASEEFLAELAPGLDARRTCFAVTVFEGRELGTRIVSAGGDVVVPREADSFPYKKGVFVQTIHPPLQLLIWGDGPDSVPLRSLAELLGWIPIEIADRHSLKRSPDEWTAAIVKSHNYGRDFAALQALLPLNLRYVGLIGPRRRRDQLLNDLLDAGIPINGGFFSPAGVDFGAETPEEIALAVVSEIQRVFAGGTGESLRERKVSIHSTKESPPKPGSKPGPSPHLYPLFVEETPG